MRKSGLHNLVGMQVAMGRLYGWTASRTVAVLDGLHETGAITDPRTESRMLDADSLPQARAAMNLLRSAGRNMHPDADATLLLAGNARRTELILLEIPGIMPVAPLPPCGEGAVAEQVSLHDDHAKAYEEIVAQFISAIAPESVS